MGIVLLKDYYVAIRWSVGSLTQIYPLQGSHVLSSSWAHYTEVEGSSERSRVGSMWVKTGPPGQQCTATSRLEGVDTNLRPHVCQYCGYSFCRPSQLATHIRIHTGEKPYCCTVCSYSAAQKGNMRRHMHLVHGIVLEPSLGSTNVTTP